MGKVKVKTQIPVETPAKPPTIIYIFGGSGDLAYRKLMPALYSLAHDGMLPPYFSIISPMFVFEPRSRIDFPTARTMFCFLSPHMTCIEMLHLGKSA